MKHYPIFTTGHECIVIPQEERRMAFKRFVELWGPVLKENGFVRTRNHWWRVNGGQILQGIKFDPKPSVRHETDLIVYYDQWPLFVEHSGFPPPGTLILPQQHFTDYVYPGWPTHQHHGHLGRYTDDGVPLGKEHMLEYTDTVYCSFFNALHSVEDALEAELELFCERTLPEFNRVSDPRSYAEKEFDLRPPLFRQHMTCLSPEGVDMVLALPDWKMAERSLRACLRFEERIGRTDSNAKTCFDLNNFKVETTGHWYYDWYANTLSHVLRRDEEWLENHFRENTAKSWKILERWNPRLYKKYAPK